jgi:hypothetical protein
MDDFAPYVYRTRDRGETWDLVADGIADDAFVRAVREDPVVEGLLYAGTETGVYYSPNAGDSWHPLQLELPVVPVTDLAVKDDDLVISTQGRSFWILDDLAVLRQTKSSARRGRDRAAGARRRRTARAGTRRACTSTCPRAREEAPVMRFLDADGEVIRAFAVETEDVKAKSKKGMGTINAEPGMNLFRWNYRYERPERVPGAVAWPSHPPGPRVVPGPTPSSWRRARRCAPRRSSCCPTRGTTRRRRSTPSSSSCSGRSTRAWTARTRR